MKSGRIAGLSAAVLFLLASATYAQHGQGWQEGAGGMGGMAQRMYDPATVVTVSGIVESIDNIASKRGTGYGVHLELKTDKETVSVHLGPGWFIEKQETKIMVGDTIKVKGSRMTIENAPSVIAAEVTKDGSTLKLRDENGVPAWAGKKKAGQGRSQPY